MKQANTAKTSECVIIIDHPLRNHHISEYETKLIKYIQRNEKKRMKKEALLSFFKK